MANAKIIESKAAQVAELAEKIKKAKSVILFDYRGLTVAEVTDLRNEMRKDWFSLNWPMLVLSFVGMLAFGALDFFLIKRIDLLPTFVLVGGVALLMFYLPFYFANMETIYKKYETNFKEGNQEAIETILSRIQSSIDLSEEEKRNLEASLRGQDNQNDEDGDK